MIVPPGKGHHAEAKRRKGVLHEAHPYRRFVFWISTKFIEELLKMSNDFGYLVEMADRGRYAHHLEDALFREVQTRALSLLEELHTDHYGRETFMKIYAADMILTLTRFVYEAEHKVLMKKDDDVFRGMLQYINEDPARDLSLKALSEHFFVSRSYIVHSFKNSLGISIHQYIMKKRLSRCRDAIMDGVSISEASRNYGFNDYSNFYKAFKREYGCSPSEYLSTYMVE
jgi:AraC-like DNA-binding protein